MAELCGLSTPAVGLSSGVDALKTRFVTSLGITWLYFPRPISVQGLTNEYTQNPNAILKPRVKKNSAIYEPKLILVFFLFFFFFCVFCFLFLFCYLPIRIILQNKLKTKHAMGFPPLKGVNLTMHTTSKSCACLLPIVSKTVVLRSIRRTLCRLCNEL